MLDQISSRPNDTKSLCMTHEGIAIDLMLYSAQESADGWLATAIERLRQIHALESHHTHGGCQDLRPSEAMAEAFALLEAHMLAMEELSGHLNTYSEAA